MNRRGFLGAILAAAVAPAVVRADSLMRIVPRETTIEVPDFMIRQRWITVDEAHQLFPGEIGRWEGVRIIPHSKSCIAEAKVLQDIVNREFSEYMRRVACEPPFARRAASFISGPYVGDAV